MGKNDSKRFRGVPGESDTLADRLRWAIERQPRQGRQRGLRLFQRRMEERAKEILRAGGPPLTGTHLSTIQGYVNGTAEPSRQFLVEAARVLGVREAWLILGEGAPTEEEEQAIKKALADLAAAGRFIVRQMQAVAESEIARAFPAYPYLPHATRAELWRMFDRFIKYAVKTDRLGDPHETLPIDGWRQAGAMFGRYLNAAFDLFGVEPARVPAVELALILDAAFRPVTIITELRRHGEPDDLNEGEAHGEA